MKNFLAHMRWGRGALAPRDEPTDARLRRQAALAYLSRKALRAPACSGLLGDVCGIAARVLSADHVHVLELLPDARTVLARATAGWAPERLALWQADVAPQSRLGQALRTGAVVLIDETTDAQCTGGGSDLLGAVGMRVGLAIGIPTGDGHVLFGVYSASPRRFSRDDVQFVRAVAQIVESAISREAQMVSDRTARALDSAAQADLLRLVVGRLRPALRESVGHLWSFRTQRTDTFTFRRAVKLTERQVAVVADFIEDLAMLADVLDGRLPGRRLVPIAPVVRSIVDQLKPVAEARAIVMKLNIVDELAVTSGSHDLLRRALLNLADNALQCTGAQGRVTVTLTSLDAAAAVVEIADTGRGMTREQLERLSANREGSGDGDDRGPGLGWRLASAIVQAHGGSVTASSPGHQLGSTVVVRLPRLASPAV